MEYEELMKKISVFSKEDQNKIMRAYELADTLHKGVLRQSGEPYITHPLNVAIILLENNIKDADTICAALLHDTIEDTPITKEEIERQFNKTVAKLVNGVTKISGKNKEEKYNNNLLYHRQIINSFNDEYRIVLIKLADRLHNMRTLQYKKREKQIENAKETMEIFVPLAKSFGAYKIEKELMDLSFKYLEPEKYNELYERNKEKSKIIIPELEEINEKIEPLARERGIIYTPKIGERSLYQIQEKINQGYDFDELVDSFWLKFIINGDDNIDCSTLSGIITDNYKIVPGSYKDYISTPRSNDYRSLHMKVLDDHEKIKKLKIRTAFQDLIATSGIVALNKTPREIQRIIRNDNSISKRIELINNSSQNNIDYVDAFINEGTEEQIYVLDTHLNWVVLPKHSTVADYVFQINPDLAFHIEDMVVNGKHVGLNKILRNEDIIKVTFNKDINIDPFIISKALTNKPSFMQFQKVYKK